MTRPTVEGVSEERPLTLGFDDSIRDKRGRQVATVSFRKEENEHFLAEADARATMRVLVERYNAHDALRQQLAELRSANKASHVIQTHLFADHEMTWDERCVNCGAFDSELKASACNHSKQLAEMRGALERIDEAASGGNPNFHFIRGIAVAALSSNPQNPNEPRCESCGGTTGFVMNRGAIDVCDDPIHDKAAALAPTSQPERGKCETCGGAKHIHAVVPGYPLATKPCPDCAQPSREPECACGHPYACGAAERPSRATCETCKGFKVVNVDDWHQTPCQDCTQPSLPAGSLAAAIEDAQRTVAGWPEDVRAAMGAQPEWQGADK